MQKIDTLVSCTTQRPATVHRTRLGRLALFLPLFVFSALYGFSAQAEMITFGPLPFAISGMGSSSVEIPQFDPEMGVLTGVSVTLDASISDMRVQCDNEQDVSYVLRSRPRAGVRLVGPELTLMTLSQAIFPSTTLSPDSDGAPDFVGTDAFTVLVRDTPDSQTNSPGDLAGYIGTGVLSLALTNQVTWNLGPGVAWQIFTPGETSGSVTVTYEYSLAPVPEPGSLALLGVGAISLILVMRRRRIARLHGPY